MAMPAWIPESWAKLNDANKKQAEDFIQFLLLKQKEETLPGKEGFPFGILRGKIKISDDFDDPLPEFEEYM